MPRLIKKVFKVDGVATAPDSALLSDPTNSFGVKRTDTNAVVVANGTPMVLVAPGTYQYQFDDLPGVAYSAFVEFNYDGASYHFEVEFPAISSGTASGIDYTTLRNRVGHYLFGVEGGYSSEQMTRIKYCISDGLNRVYSIHDWSFFRPLATVTTVLGQPEVSMPSAFADVSGDSDLVYLPGDDEWYPSVKIRHDSVIRKLQSSNPENGRPAFYSVRTTLFDPDVGSRKSIVFYPTPDAVYTLKAPMILRPVEINSENPYPVGGSVLGHVILEACLASAEHNYEEREHVHEKRFQELISIAIQRDQERSSPTSLGPDLPKGENGKFGVFDYNFRSREQRIGSLTFGGELL
jgi:hypothetical protein